MKRVPAAAWAIALAGFSFALPSLAGAVEQNSSTCPIVGSLRFAAVPGGTLTMGRVGGFRDERPVHKVSLQPLCVSVRTLEDKDIKALAAELGDPWLGPNLDTSGGLNVALEANGHGASGKGAAAIQAALTEFQRDNQLPPSGRLDAATRAKLQARAGRRLSKINARGGFQWTEASSLASKLTAHYGKAVRLPTEAEWEWLARGGLEQKTTPWGDPSNTGPGRRIQAFLNDHTKGCPQDYDEASKHIEGPPNGYGIEDLLSGWEWTSSIYAPYPYKPNDGREQPDPSVGSRSIRGNGGGIEMCQISVPFRGYTDLYNRVRVRFVYSR